MASGLVPNTSRTVFMGNISPADKFSSLSIPRGAVFGKGKAEKSVPNSGTLFLCCLFELGEAVKRFVERFVPLGKVQADDVVDRLVEE